MVATEPYTGLPYSIMLLMKDVYSRSKVSLSVPHLVFARDFIMFILLRLVVLMYSTCSFQVSRPTGPSRRRPRKVCSHLKGISTPLIRRVGSVCSRCLVKHMHALFCALTTSPHLVAHVVKASTAACSWCSASPKEGALHVMETSSA